MTVELVEAAPVAGALRFKLLRDDQAAARGGWTSIAAAADNRAPAGAARTARQDLMSDDIESAVPGGRLIDPNEARPGSARR